MDGSDGTESTHAKYKTPRTTQSQPQKSQEDRHPGKDEQKLLPRRIHDQCGTSVFKLKRYDLAISAGRSILVARKALGYQNLSL